LERWQGCCSHEDEDLESSPNGFSSEDEPSELLDGVLEVELMLDNKDDRDEGGEAVQTVLLGASVEVLGAGDASGSGECLSTSEVVCGFGTGMIYSDGSMARAGGEKADRKGAA